MLLSFVLCYMRLSDNIEHRGKGSLGWKGSHSAKSELYPCIPHCWADVLVHPGLLIASAVPPNIGSGRSFSQSSLRSKTHLHLKGHISLCSLIRYPFDLTLQRQTKKTLIDNFFCVCTMTALGIYMFIYVWTSICQDVFSTLFQKWFKAAGESFGDDADHLQSLH